MGGSRFPTRIQAVHGSSLETCTAVTNLQRGSLTQSVCRIHCCYVHFSLLPHTLRLFGEIAAIRSSENEYKDADANQLSWQFAGGMDCQQLSLCELFRDGNGWPGLWYC